MPYHIEECYEDKTILIEEFSVEVYERCFFKNCHFKINNPCELSLYNNVYRKCTFDVDFSYTESLHFGLNEFTSILSLDSKSSVYDMFSKTLSTPVPPEGKSFTGYKMLRSATNERWAIAKLRIPEDAHRSCAGTQSYRKCRASSAYVEAIYEIKGIYTNTVIEDGIKSICPILDSTEMELVPVTEFYNNCFNKRGWDTNYVVGKEIVADSWDFNRFAECTHGIHFFLDLRAAIIEMAFFISNLQRDKLMVEFSRKERGE